MIASVAYFFNLNTPFSFQGESCTGPQMIPTRKWSQDRKWSPNWTANDPKTRNDPQIEPQMIPGPETVA